MEISQALKSPLKNESVRNILCWLASYYIRFVFNSSRWKIIGLEAPKAFWDEGRPFILAFWHGRMLMMPYCWRSGKKIHMLISQHRDGLIISRIVNYFGINTIPGSTHKGGSVALRTLLKALKAGEYVGITPDGPQGPGLTASEGIVQVARLSGVPVIPCTFSTKWRHLLSTWDRFLVALPFSRGVFIWGTPIFLSKRASAEEQEEFRLRVESSLNAITLEADRLVKAQQVRHES